MTKVFCIGFHKTGTKSLASALRILGYSVTGPNGVADPDIASNVHALTERLVKKYDAFQDNPWPILYRELDEKYPASKFILTLRPTNAWIRSQVRHFGERSTPMRTWIYGVGCPKGNEAIYIARYEKHNADVQAYFRDRPTEFLVLTLGEGNEWERLCPFLGREIPTDMPFPHRNRAEVRENPDRHLIPSTRRLLKRVMKRSGKSALP